jgi:hypothetical protein
VSLLLTVVLKPILSVWIMEAMQVRVLVKVWNYSFLFHFLFIFFIFVFFLRVCFNYSNEYLERGCEFFNGCYSKGGGCEQFVNDEYGCINRNDGQLEVGIKFIVIVYFFYVFFFFFCRYIFNYYYIY